MEGFSENVDEFYDNIADEYTSYISRCVPRYAEMLWAILRYIPSQFAPRKIIDLGCGTGNLTILLLKTFPGAEVHLVDISEKMIEECSKRFQSNPMVTLHCSDFRDLKFADESVDLVVSSISIHHIVDHEKEQLFKDIYSLLKPDGVFSYSDQFSAPFEDSYLKNMESWHNESLQKNVSETEWQMWMDHQDSHDHHTTLDNQMKWLELAGFRGVDCVWRYLLWTVMVGRK